MPSLIKENLLFVLALLLLFYGIYEIVFTKSTEVRLGIVFGSGIALLILSIVYRKIDDLTKVDGKGVSAEFKPKQ